MSRRASSESHVPEPALRLSGLGVGYRRRGYERLVLREMTAVIHPGELVCLVGPNGAGKSTLLRTIAGLQPPLAGELILTGTPVGRLRRSEVARITATVLTDRVDPGRFTVRELVGLGRHSHTSWMGRLEDRDHEIIDRALVRTGASAFADNDFNELSDGQRQRVLVARALAQQPRLLLLDEPTAFLDPPAKITLLQLLLEIARADRVAVLVSTHDLELAARSADTVWVAAPGGSIDTGGPEDLVSSGRLCAPFACAGIEFDAETLGFVAVNAERPAATVRADGPAAMLAAHALRRAGYRVGDHGDQAAIEIVRRGADGDSPHADAWTLRHDGVCISLANLDEVSRHARCLLAAVTRSDPAAPSRGTPSHQQRRDLLISSAEALSAVDG